MKNDYFLDKKELNLLLQEEKNIYFLDLFKAIMKHFECKNKKHNNCKRKSMTEHQYCQILKKVTTQFRKEFL